MRPVACLSLVMWIAAAPAAAEEEPPVAGSMAAGIALAMVPLAVGSTLIANSPNESVQNAGLFTLMGGLALAPILSHAIAGEWKRAVVFAALPVAGTVAMAVLVSQVPNVIADLGVAETRVPFAASLIAAVFGSAGGLADSFLAGARARARRVSLVPTVGPHQVGLAIGGLL
jgi:hypothetical protein